MFEELDNVQQYGSIGLLIVSMIAIFMSGIFLGIMHYTMDVTEDAFRNVDCTIENNVYVGNCQDLWDLAVYPFFALKDIFVWFSFFFIFALTLSMLVVGYQSGKSPVLLGVLIFFVIIFTYFGIEISNVYRTMLENDLFRSMMVNFTVYNKIMLNLPWYNFIVGLFSVILSVVNFQKIQSNTPTSELDY